MGGMAETLGDQPDDKGSPLGTVILVGSLFALLAGTVAFAWHTWRMMDVEVGFDGMVIAAVGSAFGIVLGVVLMRLCYISSRRGYDDEVGKD
jgi:hypothetical protein